MSEPEKTQRFSQKKSKIKKGPSEDKTLSLGSGVGCISTFVLLVAIFVLYDIVFVSSEESIDFKTLKTDLENEVHNQSAAISTISGVLSKIEKGAQGVTVVNFIGSTGVGKTFVANLIKKYFHSFFYESWRTIKPARKQEILDSLKRSDFSYNLIVLDDLVVSDIDDVLSFIQTVPECVTLVVCIFNIQETDDVLNHRINYKNTDEIINKFKTVGIAQDVARFHEFSKEGAGNWIVKQLITKGVNPESHLKIVKSLLESQNVKYHGLKGLSSKLRLEL